MSAVNGRRLSPEEIQANLPKILAAAARRQNSVEERKAFTDFKKMSSSSSVGEGGVAAAFRKAVSEGVRFRASSGRFMALPKNK